MNTLYDNNNNHISTSPNLPWNTSWPSTELEVVLVCPVCGSSDRTVLHKDIIDNVFFVAPGKWCLHSCESCKSAYLDPRPNQTSIGKAYGTYYTHEVGTPRNNETPLAGFGRLRREMSNGYLNRRYGTKWQPASNFGYWLAKFFPRKRQVMDTEFRYLPRPTRGQRLLDVGCGNGDFLVRAREAGWLVMGLDPDPKAAEAARQRGVDVTVGTVGLLAGESDCFDAITLSHVIEHVHDPKQLLQAVYRLLKPGGVVYIDTPNIQSTGAKLFGKNWRGIETPRHLVLFNPTSLTKLLTGNGYGNVKMERMTAVRKRMYLKSILITKGHSPYSAVPVSLGLITKLDLLFFPQKTCNLEFITLTAQKMSS